MLTETGLKGALQALAERTFIPTTLRGAPDERYPAAIESTAYFVVSEALANVAKHAEAANAEIVVTRSAGLLAVQVGDDGTGGAHLDGGPASGAWLTASPRSEARCA